MTSPLLKYTIAPRLSTGVFYFGMEYIQYMMRMMESLTLFLILKNSNFDAQLFMLHGIDPIDPTTTSLLTRFIMILTSNMSIVVYRLRFRLFFGKLKTQQLKWPNGLPCMWCSFFETPRWLDTFENIVIALGLTNEIFFSSKINSRYLGRDVL